MRFTSRPFTDADLPGLQHALATWIRDAGRCGYRHPGDVAHRLYENLRGQPIGELVHVWEDDSTAIGIEISLLFGRAFDVFVHPQLRGSDAEREMLRSAAETTRRYIDDDDHTVITDVFSCDETRIALLTELGFGQYRIWDHITERDLTGTIPAPSLPEGFVIRSATMDDAAQLADARNGAFADDWTADTYRAAVMEKPGYEPEREIVVVSPDGRIAAFAVTWLDALNNVGLFEPVGTHPDFRRRGFARAVMLSGLHDMQRHGMTSASVEHDATNTAALELYRGLGFQKKYETLGFKSHLGQAS